MRFLKILLIVIVTSCSGKEDLEFNKIDYKLTDYSYSDSLPTKIIPDKKYDYWACIKYENRFSEKKHTIIKQAGNLQLSKKIQFKTKENGFFSGCIPSYCCQFIITIKEGKINYISTEDGLKDFIGGIDNIEEALLIAKIHDYRLDFDVRGSAYREKDGNYELHLTKYHQFLPLKEYIEVKINREGYLKTKIIELVHLDEKRYPDFEE